MLSPDKENLHGLMVAPMLDLLKKGKDMEKDSISVKLIRAVIRENGSMAKNQEKVYSLLPMELSIRVNLAKDYEKALEK